VIDGPFLLAARSKMWTMVVLDQLGRPPNTPNVLKPLAYLVVGWPSVRSDEKDLRIAVVFGAVLLAVLVLRAWRVPLARVIVLMLLAQLALVMAEPSWFQFYADYVTVGFSLVVGAACVRRDATSAVPASVRRPMKRDAPPWLVVAVVACLGSVIALTVPEDILVTGVPAARLTMAAEGYRCVMTDSPMALIDMNLLTTELRRGCPDMVDVTGLIFVLDHQDHRRGVIRTWNSDMISYLRSGDAMLFFRPPRAIDLLPATAQRIETNGVLVKVGEYGLYRVLHATPSSRSTITSVGAARPRG
jgi:hypothetical protein